MLVDILAQGSCLTMENAITLVFGADTYSYRTLVDNSVCESTGVEYSVSKWNEVVNQR